ncbi:multiple inositol polyphosphate phosphatase [Teratosphaeria nubilosa]|uniref:Multiple inositol polyphosphate phosphatase n=1 Tax=Teratosphaeria nubilosa TaxID=161662 RepID=A0A6G1LFY4_9PEZI|nr:multiple inositol polyphosphate phosphatase [Teratosphaeria nubilosa]
MAAIALALCAFGASAKASYNPLHVLGGNSQYFPGENVFNISSDPPAGCVVDQAAFTCRHGSRYPDPSAYEQWVTLAEKIHASNFTVKSPEFEFLKTWQPVLSNPAAQISEISIGGYRELYNMGVDYRREYPDFYTENEPFVLWANRYEDLVFRVVDSARLFARGYMGPNATADGSVYVLNQSDPRSVANSLAASDLCSTYSDAGGGSNLTTWQDIYLPPFQARVASLVPGINFSTTDISIFPYLCGFETQITGKLSPWCNTFTEEEGLQYEYAQDLRYWYGDGGLGTTGPGRNLMLQFLTDLVNVFVSGPNASYSNCNSSTSFTSPRLIATFTNDGQVNQLASAIGVFDQQAQLPSTYIPTDRIFKATAFDTMRGTIGFERLNCGSKGLFMRLKLNEQVYPVPYCKQGPGQSCPLKQYQSIIANKTAAFGDFEVACGISNSSVVPLGKDRTTFLTDLSLPWEYVVKP